MSEQGLAQAEQRVREMNRMTRQYTEQGNRFMQQNFRSPQNSQTRFEQVGQNSTYGAGQSPHMRNASAGQSSARIGQTQQTRQVLQIPQTEPPAQELPPMRNHNAGNNSAGGLAFLSDLKLDNEKLMIMLIMYLLIKEKSDIKLILALGYLLL